MNTPCVELLSGDARHVAPLLLGAVLTHDRPRRHGLGADHRGGGLPRSARLAAPGPRVRTPSADPRPATRPCSDRPGTCTSTSPTGCTTAPTLSADRRAWPRRCCCAAGEIVAGEDLARARRPTSKSPKDLASGPARLATALGLTTADSGRDALGEPFRLELPVSRRTRHQLGAPRRSFRRRRQPRLSLAVLAHRRSHGLPLQGGESPSGLGAAAARGGP